MFVGDVYCLSKSPLLIRTKETNVLLNRCVIKVLCTLQLIIVISSSKWTRVCSLLSEQLVFMCKLVFAVEVSWYFR